MVDKSVIDPFTLVESTILNIVSKRESSCFIVCTFRLSSSKRVSSIDKIVSPNAGFRS